MDKTGTGQLGERELGNALVNGDYTHFDPHTVKMMIRMFDVDKSGTIGFDEFWYLPLLLSPTTATSTDISPSKRSLGFPSRLAPTLRPLRRRPLWHH